MPDRQPLTPQEFDDVVNRAIKTAPPGLSEDEFENYIQQAAHRDEAAKAASVPPAGADIKFTPGGLVTGFLRGLGGIASGLGNAVLHPLDTTAGMVKSQFVDEPVKAYQALKEGRIMEGLGHEAAALVPIVGPAAANIGENIVKTGDVGEGVGEAGSLIATSPSIAGPVLKAAGRGGQAAASALRVPARWAGAGAIMHGQPAIGAGVMAAPKLLDLVSRGVEGAGGAYQALGRLPERAAASLRSLLENLMPDQVYAEGVTPEMVDDLIRRNRGRVSREVPGSRYQEVTPTPEPPTIPPGMTPLEYVRSMRNAGKLATTPRAGGWTGDVGSGPPPGVLEGEIVGEPTTAPGVRGIAGTAPQPAGGLPPGPPAPAALPAPSYIEGAPSSLEALFNQADRRMLELSRMEPPDPYVGSPEQLAASGEAPTLESARRYLESQGRAPAAAAPAAPLEPAPAVAPAAAAPAPAPASIESLVTETPTAATRTGTGVPLEVGKRYHASFNTAEGMTTEPGEVVAINGDTVRMRFEGFGSTFEKDIPRSEVRGEVPGATSAIEAAISGGDRAPAPSPALESLFNEDPHEAILNNPNFGPAELAEAERLLNNGMDPADVVSYLEKLQEFNMRANMNRGPIRAAYGKPGKP